MSELENKTCLISDDGQFAELAIRLSKEFGRVYFWNPSLIEGFPTAPKASIGSGFAEMEWVEDIWEVKDKVDLFIFPDCSNAGLQAELESQGKRVIGSRTGQDLEMRRIWFKKLAAKLGLEIAKHVVIEGLAALRSHLQKVEDRWIKVSKYRGSFESEHHINYELSQPWLNQLAVDLGPLADQMQFLVEEPVRGEVEYGYDGFCFNGQFPETTLFGPEIKSKCYIGAVTPYQDLDELLLQVNESLAPELAKRGYRNFLSTEVVRADGDDNFKDGTPILHEPTCRIPSPPFEAELEAYGNLGAMLWHGSVGEVIKPEMTDEFFIVCRIAHDAKPEGWRPFQIPDEVRQWVKLYDAIKWKDTYWIVPKMPHADRIGAVVGKGETVQAAIEHCSETLEALKSQPISSEFKSFADALKQLEAGQEQGIEFGEKELPEPASILDNGE